MLTESRLDYVVSGDRVDVGREALHWLSRAETQRHQLQLMLKVNKLVNGLVPLLLLPLPSCAQVFQLM